MVSPYDEHVPDPTTDDDQRATTPETATGTETADADSRRATVPPGQMPEYKGEPLDSDRGPGLGCFWIQIGLLTFFLVFTPLTVTWGWPPLVSGALLIFTLILLLFSGQTVIFLLRLVAADRRTRRTPLSPGAKPTVGQMDDAQSASSEEPATTPPETEVLDDRTGGDPRPGGQDSAGGS